MSVIDDYQKKLDGGYNLTLNDCEIIMQYRRSIGQGINAGNKLCDRREENEKKQIILRY